MSWYDALRFCNWLHNGRPAGAQDNTTTEDGAYTLTGATSDAAGTDPIHGANGRNMSALFHLPSENEWYKVAYHVPDLGDTYYLYPTGSNTAPTVASADANGKIDNDNDNANIANYERGADWNGQDGNVTAVGSGGPGSASVFGAYDMGGNLKEWNEQINGEGARGRRSREGRAMESLRARLDAINSGAVLVQSFERNWRKYGVSWGASTRCPERPRPAQSAENQPINPKHEPRTRLQPDGSASRPYRN